MGLSRLAEKDAWVWRHYMGLSHLAEKYAWVWPE